jgi:hypothetical protein
VDRGRVLGRLFHLLLRLLQAEGGAGGVALQVSHVALQPRAGLRRALGLRLRLRGGRLALVEALFQLPDLLIAALDGLLQLLDLLLLRLQHALDLCEVRGGCVRRSRGRFARLLRWIRLGGGHAGGDHATQDNSQGLLHSFCLPNGESLTAQRPDPKRLLLTGDECSMKRP